MGLQLAITNNSGVDNSKVYWAAYGLNGSGDDAMWSYVKSDGTLQECKKSDDCSTYFNSVEDLSSLSSFPQMWSGIILFSFNKKPEVFNVVTAYSSPGVVSTKHGGLGIQAPSFNPGAADQYTTFLMAELTYTPDGIWCNPTNVNYFCVPLSVVLTGSSPDSPQSRGALKAGSSRNGIFTDFESIDKFSNLLMKDEAGTSYVRVLSPSSAIVVNKLSADYYDAYVDQCWTIYAKDGGKTLTVDTGSTGFGKYTGQVDSSGKLNFTKEGGTTTEFSFDKPAPGKSADVFGCVGTLNAINGTAQGAVAAILGAALNRSVLHNQSTQPYCNSADFYQTNSESWYRTNYYSSVMHKHTKAGQIYAFPYDDVCAGNGQSSLIHDPNPTELAITLDAWTASKKENPQDANLATA